MKLGDYFFDKVAQKYY